MQLLKSIPFGKKWCNSVDVFAGMRDVSVGNIRSDWPVGGGGWRDTKTRRWRGLWFWEDCRKGVGKVWGQEHLSASFISDLTLCLSVVLSPIILVFVIWSVFFEPFRNFPSSTIHDLYFRTRNMLDPGCYVHNPQKSLRRETLLFSTPTLLLNNGTGFQ